MSSASTVKDLIRRFAFLVEFRPTAYRKESRDNSRHEVLVLQVHRPGWGREISRRANFVPGLLGGVCLKSAGQQLPGIVPTRSRVTVCAVYHPGCVYAGYTKTLAYSVCGMDAHLADKPY